MSRSRDVRGYRAEGLVDHRSVELGSRATTVGSSESRDPAIRGAPRTPWAEAIARPGLPAH